MPISPPASAAMKAAASEQLRIEPPESLKRSARKRTSMSSAVGAASGRTSRQMRSRSLGLGEREVDDDVEAAQERVVHVLAEVRRQDHRAGVALHLLQQVGDLDVRVAVVGVAHLRALAEERVGLVEEEDRVRPLGGREDPVEVLLRLPDVLRDDGREVEPEEVEAEVAREHLAGHRLAGSGLAGEEHLDAPASRATVRS